jgi:hypothetical protein
MRLDNKIRSVLFGKQSFPIFINDVLTLYITNIEIDL